MALEKPPAEYPEGFNPDRFFDSQMYLVTLDTPGIVSIGGEVSSLDEIEGISDEMKEMGVVGVFPLVLHNVNEESGEVNWEGYFPVYYTETLSTVGEYKFNLPYPVTEVHVRWAEEYFVSELSGRDWPEGLRRNIIRGLAANKAFSDAKKGMPKAE